MFCANLSDSPPSIICPLWPVWL